MIQLMEYIRLCLRNKVQTEISCFKCSDQDSILFLGKVTEHLSWTTDCKFSMLPKKVSEWSLWKNSFKPRVLR